MTPGGVDSIAKGLALLEQARPGEPLDEYAGFARRASEACDFLESPKERFEARSKLLTLVLKVFFNSGIRYDPSNCVPCGVSGLHAHAIALFLKVDRAPEAVHFVQTFVDPTEIVMTLCRKTSNRSSDVLFCTYVAGCAFSRVFQYESAIKWFRRCVECPGNDLSRFQVEARKKEILCWQCAGGAYTLRGRSLGYSGGSAYARVPPPRRCASQSVLAKLDSAIPQAYTTGVFGSGSAPLTASPGGDEEDDRPEVASSSSSSSNNNGFSRRLTLEQCQVFAKDGNWYLAERAETCFLKRSVSRLTSTFETISISAIDPEDLRILLELKEAVVEKGEYVRFTSSEESASARGDALDAVSRDLASGRIQADRLASRIAARASSMAD